MTFSHQSKQKLHSYQPVPYGSCLSLSTHVKLVAPSYNIHFTNWQQWHAIITLA